ncbi:hypothetical protein [Ochrovirga pacifica]|uniref:hypothetical protein n=1 Tax=Ochrovirga pacifica TaxID=1042376 RepID=UPI0002559554|nr:hypothetical protein [Ochrovirga pacifica]
MKLLKTIGVFFCFTCIVIGQEKPKEVIHKYINAIGGMNLLRQVKTLNIVSETEIHQKKIRVENKLKAPNLKCRMVFREDKLISKIVFNGTSAYEIKHDKKKKLNNKKEQEFRKKIAIFSEFKYLNNSNFVRQEYVNGELCNVIGFWDKEIFYSKKTGLKLKEAVRIKKQGNKILQETYYQEYKSVEGILFPVKYLVQIGDAKVYHVVKSIAINRDVSDSDFE